MALHGVHEKTLDFILHWPDILGKDSNYSAVVSGYTVCNITIYGHLGVALKVVILPKWAQTFRDWGQFCFCDSDVEHCHPFKGPWLDPLAVERVRTHFCGEWHDLAGCVRRTPCRDAHPTEQVRARLFAQCVCFPFLPSGSVSEKDCFVGWNTVTGLPFYLQLLCQITYRSLPTTSMVMDHCSNIAVEKGSAFI